MKPFVWQIDMSLYLNTPVKIETNDGHVRLRTKITEIRWANFTVDGKTVQYPLELVFENDDGIPFSQMRSIARIK